MENIMIAKYNSFKIRSTKYFIDTQLKRYYVEFSDHFGLTTVTQNALDFSEGSHLMIYNGS